MSPRGGFSDGQEAAVIDVGSNSVRLVIYRIDGRAMTPVFNEKVMAGLGRDLPGSGRLAPEGADSAVRALKRYAAIVESRGVGAVFPVATAAVRDAKDGPDFVRRVDKEAGLKLRVLTGEEEARLSALGVSASAPNADGVVGDLGGASLELIALTPGEPARGETFALGPLTLARAEGFDYDRVVAEVREKLARASVLTERGGDFYAVGGAWRALGRLDIAHHHHVLAILDHHEIPRRRARAIIDVVRQQSRRSLERLEEAVAKRAEALPYAAVVLEQVLEIGGFQRVIISAYGLREGVLLDRMSAEALKADPLIASAEAFANLRARPAPFGAALADWIAPVFEAREPAFDAKRDPILRAAAARLANPETPVQPGQRGDVIFETTLRAPLAALSHHERAFLAASVHHRYTKAPPSLQDDRDVRDSERVLSPVYEKLMTDEMRATALALGAALRLGSDLSGRCADILRQFSLRVQSGELVLRAKAAHLAPENAGKRLDALAGALGLKGRIDLG
ncbi:MAG: Ppx/GppA family phosphatase [Hyphomonadaceae bacterium]